MQQQGGSPYGVPPPAMAPFPPQLPAEATRPPPPPPPSSHSLDDLVSAASGSFPDDEGAGGSGNRWPRQETLALLKIRSDMDAAFRDSPIKGPLWEDVSKKLAELGYIRSSKKCKEKFENVHKYYKRTKETKAGRPDGKSYRFFTQLEALHTAVATMAQPIATASPAPSPTTPVGANVSVPSSARAQPTLVSAPLAPTIAPPVMTTFTTPAAMAGITFSSDTFTTSSESDEASEGRKRKREVGSGGASPPGVSRKIMEFFEGLMKQVTDRQEAMQQRFIEAIEKTEQDRVDREEAWKRQEMARLSREHEILAQERAMAASRDAAVIAFLQKISGYPLQAPPVAAVPAATAPPSQPKPHPQPTRPPTNGNAQLQVQIQLSSSSTEIVAVPDGGRAGEGVPASSRWPKQEIHTLINIRSGLEEKYQEAGPKGPLWEEISAAMARQGYNRSAKRCKEKWENINKYFKKVRESNKRRPEDAKTCPYYHDLELLYRRKLVNGGGANSGVVALPPFNSSNPTPHAPITIAPPQLSHQLRQPATENKISSNGEVGGNSVTVQIQANNGGPPVSFFQDATTGNTTMKKHEQVMKMMEQQQAAMDDYDKLEEHGSDDMDDEDDEEDEDDMKMQYTIQYQKQNGGGDASSAKQSAAATTGPFLAMVQ